MRTISAGMGSALTASAVIPVYFVELVFDSGTVYLNTTGVDIAWNGHTWNGAEAMGKIEAVSEGIAGDIQGIRMELNGVPSASVSLVLTEHVQGRAVNIYLGLLDSSYAVIATPVLEWAGLMDQMTISDGIESASISVTAENRMVDYRRPRVKRYNSADQNRDNPTDEFFEYIESMVDVTIVWPAKEYFKK